MAPIKKGSQAQPGRARLAWGSRSEKSGSKIRIEKPGRRGEVRSRWEPDRGTDRPPVGSGRAGVRGYGEP